MPCDIKSSDIQSSNIIDVRTPVGIFSFCFCDIHYGIFAEGVITGRELNPKKLSKMAQWSEYDESWQP